MIDAPIGPPLRPRLVTVGFKSNGSRACPVYHTRARAARWAAGEAGPLSVAVASPRSVRKAVNELGNLKTNYLYTVKYV